MADKNNTKKHTFNPLQLCSTPEEAERCINRLCYGFVSAAKFASDGLNRNLAIINKIQTNVIEEGGDPEQFQSDEWTKAAFWKKRNLADFELFEMLASQAMIAHKDITGNKYEHPKPKETDTTNSAVVVIKEGQTTDVEVTD